MNKKYADLLTNYCVEAKPGQHILVASTYLAEPLLQEIETAILNAGAYPEFQIGFKSQSKLFYETASDRQLETIPISEENKVNRFSSVMFVDAPFDVDELKHIPADKISKRQAALGPLKQERLKKGAAGEITWVICKYPTQALADRAGMSLDTYTKFIENACFLNEKDPVAAWKRLGEKQQAVADYLNRCETVAYKSKDVDVVFSTKGRTWINSDGKRNMPSGEVFTSPVEDSVEGQVTFSYPIYYQGQEISGVTLDIEKGRVVSGKAKKGESLLNRLLSVPGADRFGEAAIGNNYNITEFTKSILFDEKIGGTIHMAIGASYPETGGKNQSGVHLDLIADMTNGSRIEADGTVIYRDGKFIEEVIKPI